MTKLIIEGESYFFVSTKNNHVALAVFNPTEETIARLKKNQNDPSMRELILMNDTKNDYLAHFYQILSFELNQGSKNRLLTLRAKNTGIGVTSTDDERFALCA